MSEPPSYPPHWEFDTVLGDGGTARVRPILPSDAPAYLRFFHGLSRESRYYRFFSPKSELTADEVAHFTTVDHADRVALIALDGDDIIAVARYDRLPEPDGDGRLGGDAEVAFTIADAHQGRGLGTLMLEYLAAAGREHGIRRFVAETMPDNRRMIAVFHAAGYQTVDRFADGMVEVEFPIAATDDAREALQRREHGAEARSIARILEPSSVVVIGPTRDSGSPAAVVLRNLRAGGFPGPVHAVEGAADLLALTEPAELAVVAGPSVEVAAVVAACAGHGVNGVVVLGQGFAEAGPEGAEREAALLTTVRHEGLRLVGPCSVGVANTAIGLDATVAPVLPPPGRIGVMADSGSVALALLARLGARGLGVSTFVCAGNKADVSGNDLLQYWEDDPGTELVLLHLESFGNPRKFARIARRVGAGTPIVAVWPGGVPGHALDDRAVDALFHQAGVVRVGSIDEMIDVAATVVGHPGLGDDAGAVLAADRHAEWRRRDPGSLPVLDDVDRAAAREAVAKALTDTRAGDHVVADPATVVALLSAYGITRADAPSGGSTTVSVGVVQDPTFGSLVTVGTPGGVPAAASDVRLVPLTDRDAAELATVLVPEPAPALEDLLVRIGLLADDVAEVSELVLDPVHLQHDVVTVAGASLRLHDAVPRPSDLVRRLRT